MGFQQLGNRHVIGVIGLEMTIGIDDGVDRLNGGGGRVQLIDQRNAGFLERHRHATAANAQGTNTADSARQVVTAEGFVVEIQPQLFIQMVVKSQAKVAGASGEDMHSWVSLLGFICM